MKLKKLMIGVLSAALVLTSAVPASACTGIYVGDEVSENGSTYMGRSEDMGYNYTKIFGVSEARDYAADYVYKDAYGFSMPYGGHVYRYTYIKDSSLNGEAMDDFEPYAEAGQNEKGVSVSSTVSIAYGDKPAAADPLVETGICEISIATVLLGKSATAKEAVDLLGSIVDTYGSGECNQVTISDPDETWYFEVVSGHQWAAVKLPSDKVVVNPNITMLGVIDVEDTKNVMSSKNLVSLAKDNNFLVTDESGKIDVAKTYADKNSGKGQYERYMQGMFYINKAEAEKISITDMSKIDNNSKASPISLLHNADRKMSTLDIMHLLSTRGEGTPYAQDEGKTGYSIGNENQAECHIFETRANMPDALATIQWQTVTPSEFSIYIPYYSALITSVIDEYNEESLSYVDDSMFWTFARIYELCSADRKNMGKAVRAYFEEYQKSLITQQKAADATMQTIYTESPEKAAAVAELVGKKLAGQVFEAAVKVQKELEAYAAGNKGKAFTLSVETKQLMPEYASLVESYAKQDNLVTALKEEVAAEQKKLADTKEKVKKLQTEVENAKTTAGVKATKVTATAKASKSSVKVSWKKSGSYNVDTYRVYRASSKNGTYKLVKEVKATETSVKLSTKGLKKGKTYYYKVRGVKTVDGKKVYTNYSSKISAKVK